VEKVLMEEIVLSTLSVLRRVIVPSIYTVASCMPISSIRISGCEGCVTACDPLAELPCGLLGRRAKAWRSSGTERRRRAC
jgi:hypothetical protein